MTNLDAEHQIFITYREACDAYSRALHAHGLGSPEQATAHRAMEAASKARIALSTERAAAGLCCVARVGFDGFVCSNRIDAGADCWVCTACQERELEIEGRADGRAAAREDHQRGE